MTEGKLIRRFRNDLDAFRRSLTIDANGGPRLFQPDDWQQADFSALDNGWRRCVGQQVDGGKSRGYLERGRGHSKTADEAIMGTWALSFAPRQISGVAAAADKDQARLIRDAIGRLVNLNSWLASALDVQNYRVVNRHTGSTLEIVSSDADTSYGLTPDFLLLDEVTHWAGRELFDSLISASAKRRDCMVVIIANAGRGRGSSWQWDVREACRLSDEWHFSRLDGPVASWMGSDRLAEQRRLLPTKVYARLWDNQWQTEVGDLLDATDIEACITLDGPLNGDETNLSFVAGLDLGVKNDRCAFIVLGVDSILQQIKLAMVRSWSPGPSGQIDLIAVEETVLAASGRYRLVSVRFDPHQAALMAQRLTRHQVRMIEVPFVGNNLNLMASTILETFRSRRIQLYRDRQLLDDLSKLSIEERSFGWKLTAPQSDQGHADSAIALAIALPAAVELAGFGAWNFHIDRNPAPELLPMMRDSEAEGLPIDEMTELIWSGFDKG